MTFYIFNVFEHEYPTVIIIKHSTNRIYYNYQNHQQNNSYNPHHLFNDLIALRICEQNQINVHIFNHN